MATAIPSHDPSTPSGSTPPAAIANIGSLDHKDRQEALTKSVEDAFERLAEQLNQGYTDDYFQFLRFYQSFHQYSWTNALLIMIQKPQAHYAASFKHWKKLGYKIKPGSKAAWIWVPMFRKEKDPDTGIEREVLSGFRDGGVFGDCDLEGLDEKPLPRLWKPLPDDRGALLAGYVERLKTIGIDVQFRQLAPTRGGFATAGGTSIVINSLSDSQNALMTLTHELTHCLLHFDKDNPVPEHEIEADAEACSFVIAGILGIDYRTSADYLLSKNVTAESLKASLGRVQKATRTIVRMLDIAL